LKKVQEARLSRPEAVVALIPAFKPDRLLLELVRDLRDGGFRSIIVVDDGSPPESAPMFDELAALPGCHLLRHEVNRGKGRAIKTGLAFFLERYPDADGIATADADGQHRAEDVVRVAESFLAGQSALVIGSRKFAQHAPWRSRFGNRITRQVFRWVAGVRLADTQSGLRCFSRTIAPRLMALAGERYEYEMNVLAACPKLSVPLREVGIETVYFEGNPSSHFNPVVDSAKIYTLLLRLSLAALAARLRG
jgi:glycosyltransferase involved in cell wall biosynthesis